ncbi:MAG: hypothetical protein ACHQ4J_15625, partial [Candidatus Binatia bacterium]
MASSSSRCTISKTSACSCFQHNGTVRQKTVAHLGELDAAGRAKAHALANRGLHRGTGTRQGSERVIRPGERSAGSTAASEPGMQTPHPRFQLVHRRLDMRDLIEAKALLEEPGQSVTGDRSRVLDAPQRTAYDCMHEGRGAHDSTDGLIKADAPN